MRMLTLLLVVGLAWLALAAPRVAEAKLPYYTVTGGEFGEYASNIELEHFVNYQPGLSAAAAPYSPPSPPYELYGSVLYRYLSGTKEPAFRYYREERLIEDVDGGYWFQMTPERAGELDAAIDRALELKEQDRLQRGALAASLADISQKRLRLRNILSEVRRSLYRFTQCPCDVIPEAVAEFVLSDMVETASSSPHETGPEDRPDLMITLDLEGGYGPIGFYAFPAAGRPGKFWPSVSFERPTTAYFETTPGFDAVIANALAAAQPDAQEPDSPPSSRPAAVAEESDSAVASSAIIAFALGASVAGVLGVSNALARRRAR